MRYRVGRHNPQLVYAQSGDEPDNKADSLVAVCFTGLMAAVVRDALIALPVEGSTPLDSPAPVAVHIPIAALETLRGQLAAWRSADQDGYDPGVLAEAAEVLLDRLDAAPAGEVAADMRSRRQGGRGAVAIPLSQAIAEESADSPEFAAAYAKAEPADEPVPVPPPVDAPSIFNLIEEYAAVCACTPPDDDGITSVREWRVQVMARIRDRVSAINADGVAEGRRQATEERTEVERG